MKKSKSALQNIRAISPLDGRYSDQLNDVREYFSELALTKARCQVEIAHAFKLDAIFGVLDESKKEAISNWLFNFDEQNYSVIKDYERQLRHDVKAVEFCLRQLDWDNPNRVHFALTSEDVNNLAWSICTNNFKEMVQIPSWHRLLTSLAGLVKGWRNFPMPARTHGQYASPTTAGKEIAVFVNRLLSPYSKLKNHKFKGKLNGATGTYSAGYCAAPHINWIQHEKDLLSDLGFIRNPATTQIEDHGSLCEWFDIIRSANNIIIDMCQDVWLYISYGYIKQKFVPGEVGSSTMPHKINPIRFENAEGNLLLSNALLSFMSDKLSRSRMQRDLSDSTIMRNIGVAIGHHHLALLELNKGLSQIDFDASFSLKELNSHNELLSEPVQTILRTKSSEDVYTIVKNLTRGSEDSKDLINNLLSKFPDSNLQQIKEMSVSDYIGKSKDICDDILDLASNYGIKY